MTNELLQPAATITAALIGLDLERVRTPSPAEAAQLFDEVLKAIEATMPKAAERSASVQPLSA